MSGATCSSGYTSPETITVDVHNLVYLVNNLGRVQRQQLLFLRILVLVNSLALCCIHHSHFASSLDTISDFRVFGGR